MATQLELKVEEKTLTGKEAAKKIRAAGNIPAIIYGKRDEPVMIQFNMSEFQKLVHGEAHENVIFKINLKAQKKKETFNAVIKDMQFDPEQRIAGVYYTCTPNSKTISFGWLIGF